MNTYLFRLLEPGSLRTPDPEESLVEIIEAVFDQVLDEATEWQDFRIRVSEFSEHLRAIGTISGIGADALDRLLHATPPPGMSVELEGLSYIPWADAARFARLLGALDATALDAIAEHADRDATYGVVLDSLEEAARREMDLVVLQN